MYSHATGQSSIGRGESGEWKADWRSITITRTGYAVDNFPVSSKRFHLGRSDIVEAKSGPKIRRRGGMLRMLQCHTSGYLPVTEIELQNMQKEISWNMFGEFVCVLLPIFCSASN